MPYTVPALPYAFDALEPYIDALTMEIHHDKHHGAYVAKANAALEKAPAWANKPIEEVLRNANDLPADIRQAVINNGGGHANHSLFWQIMGPKQGGPAQGPVADAIKAAFGGFEQFQKLFNDNAANRFGSGWSWLALDGQGQLKAYSTANQDSPYLQGHTPILALDVWEHAYYLKYQNKRPDYVAAWWSTVNWDVVNELYAAATR